MIVYAPGMISPGTVDTLASQIDVGPTILALLNVSYTSRFFGQDILTEGQRHQRALMANYLTVGHMENGAVVELSTKRRARVLDARSGRELPADNEAGIAAIEEAISYYQVADRVLRGR
jgi:phosphoglycerol transferase MdoB-like AlkP superfamily enzyme